MCHWTRQNDASEMGQTAPNDPETPWEVDCVVIELRVKRTTAAPAAGDGFGR